MMPRSRLLSYQQRQIHQRPTFHERPTSFQRLNAYHPKRTWWAMLFSCLNSTYHGTFQDNSDDELICRAITSCVISSPPRKSAQTASPFTASSFPRRSAQTTLPFTTPGKRQKYYVVSIGKRTGVFDSWLYLALYILFHMIYYLFSGHTSRASPLELVEIAKSPTQRTTRPAMSIKILKQAALSGLSGIVEMRFYMGQLRML